MGETHFARWMKGKLSATARTRAAGRFEQYADDPVGFAVDVLAIHSWPRFEDVLVSVRDKSRTLTVGGHKVSKSTAAAALALWWGAAAHPTRDTRTIFTAPSAHQVKNILWNELTKRLEWLEENRPKVRAWLGGELPKDPMSGWRMASGAEILGLTSDQPERLAGISGAWVLIVIEEASGYRDDLFAAIQGNEAGGAKLFALSNPTKPSGWFFDGTTNGEWNVLRISSLESPNVEAGERLVPGLATLEWVERMKRLHGPDPESHPEYQVRVLGVFPERAENQVISMRALKDAQARWRPDLEAFGPLVIGVDPARYGVDECVIQPVRGMHAYPARILGGATDGHDIAEAVVEEVLRYRRLPEDETVIVVVDGVSTGASAVDMLRYHDAHRKRGIIGIVVHEGFRPAYDVKRFANARTEAWFALDEWLGHGGRVQPNQELQKEALAALYKFDHEARLVMEPKDRMKKRLGRSPNRADALSLAVTPRPPSAVEYQNDLPEDDDERGLGGWDAL